MKQKKVRKILKITMIEVVKKAVVKPHGVGGWGDDLKSFKNFLFSIVI